MSKSKQICNSKLLLSFKDDIESGESSFVCPECKRKVRILYHTEQTYALSCGDIITLKED